MRHNMGEYMFQSAEQFFRSAMSLTLKLREIGSVTFLLLLLLF